MHTIFFHGDTAHSKVISAFSSLAAYNFLPITSRRRVSFEECVSSIGDQVGISRVSPRRPRRRETEEQIVP